jgi:ribonuclease R
VAQGSALDTEAQRRATSVYLAGQVIPMLPETLSNDKVSLLPQVDRLALTVELRIDPEGLVTSVDVYESVICSTARLSYEEVTSYLSDGEQGNISEDVGTTLRWLRTVAARLSAVRATRGGVELAREEAKITLDSVTQEPTSVQVQTTTLAHRLVERVMVATNEAVACWLHDRGLPGMYRVHDEPGSAQVAMLKDFAHNFGIEAGFGTRLTPRGLAAFETQLQDCQLAPAVRTVMSRVLGPARYTLQPAMHYGLAAPLYLHFTSPIRRYADLAVHRLVKQYLAGQRSFEDREQELTDLAEHLNERAYRATKAERERLNMLAARYFAQHVGEVMSGHIVAVKPFGLVIQILGTGLSGTMALDTMPDAPHKIDLVQQSVVGTHHTWRVGDRLHVRVAGANESMGRIDLVPVDPS